MKNIVVLINSDNKVYLEENLKYIDRLTVPSGYELSVLVANYKGEITSVSGASDINSAAVRIIISDNVFVINTNIISDILNDFKTVLNAGMLGIMGGNDESDLTVGKAIISNGFSTTLLDEEKNIPLTSSVKFLAEYLVADIGQYKWDYGKTCSENIKKASNYYIDNGLLLFVPRQEFAWCHIDFEKINRGAALSNALQIGKKELEAGDFKFCLNENEDSLLRKYEKYKFAMRRIENRFDDSSLVRKYRNGDITMSAVSVINYFECFMKKRTYHSLISSYEGFSVLKNSNVSGPINVITSINRKYIPPLCVMMNSLFRSNPENEFHFYILNNELTKEDEELLANYVKEHNSLIDFLNINIEKYKDIPTFSWGKETLYRLEMVEILPRNVDRILYLDVDLIVQKQIKDFYFTDFEGNDLIACRDMGSNESMRAAMFDDVKDTPNYIYCCAGVILWNVEKLRAEGVNFDTYLNVAKKYNYEVKAPDQDLINYCHAGKIKTVDEYKYDCFVYGLKWTVDEVLRDVAIIHYAGPKPWDDKVSDKHVKAGTYKIWWNYVKGTPFEQYYIEKLCDYYYSKGPEEANDDD